MRALYWHKTNDVRVETIEGPRIEHTRDIIIKATESGICGSDLTRYSGSMPTIEERDTISHQPVGKMARSTLYL